MPKGKPLLSKGFWQLTLLQVYENGQLVYISGHRASPPVLLSWREEAVLQINIKHFIFQFNIILPLINSLCKALQSKQFKFLNA